MEVLCPHCHKPFNESQHNEGELVECLNCTNLFHVHSSHNGKSARLEGDNNEQINQSEQPLDLVNSDSLAKISLKKNINTDTTLKTYCPNCGYLIKENSVICINCGLNIKTGKVIENEFTSLDNGVDNRSFLVKMIQLFIDTFPGLFRPITLVLCLLCFVVAICLVLLALFVLSLGVVMAGIGIGASAMLVYSQGISFLLSGSVEFLRTAMVDFRGSKWELFLLLTFAPIIIIVIIMFAVAKYT